MATDGIAAARLNVELSIDMRHKGQINEVEVVLPTSRLPDGFHDDLANRFFARYEQLYGKSSSFRGARLEMVDVPDPRQRPDAAAQAGADPGPDRHDSRRGAARQPRDSGGTA